MPPGRRAANIGLAGIRAVGAGTTGPAIAALGFGIIIGIMNSLFGYLVFVQVLYNFMVLVVTSSVLTIMMVMVLVAASLMLLHVMNMVLGLMGMLMTSRMNVLFVLVMFHDCLTSCDV
jgi:hypothetical protein